MDILLADVQARLIDKVPALKYVDEDWGQMEDYSPNFPVKWPCALIDCFAATYENIGQKGQLGLASIRLVIADVRLSNSSARAPQGQKDKNAGFYLLMKAIYKALHGFTGHPHYSALIRTREGRIKRSDGVKAHEMIFTVEIKDVSATPQKITVARELVNVQLEAGMRYKNTYTMDGIGVDEVEEDLTVN